MERRGVGDVNDHQDTEQELIDEYYDYLDTDHQDTEQELIDEYNDYQDTAQEFADDDNDHLDTEQEFADDDSLIDDRKTAPANRKPREVKPMFYDLGQNALTFEELRARTIPARDVFNVACNYANALFGVAQLRHGRSTKNATVRYYKCACCSLRIRFDRKTLGVRGEDYFVLHAGSFPHHLLDRSNGGSSPHREICNQPKSKLITKPFIVLNHPHFLVSFQEYLPLNSIVAVHLKDKYIVRNIKLMFEKGNKSPNKAPLSPTSWNNIIDNMIDILHKQLAREYKLLPKKLVDLITANPDISVNLNTDEDGRLLRLFVGFPMARHVGTLTLPIYIADCFFYKIPSFNGVIFNICSKTPYGDIILLCFAILPKEKTRHLGWTIQCCVRHGMTFIYPLFTDQGPLIATATVLQDEQQTIEYGDEDESERTMKIFLNLMICVMHFVRGAFHHSDASMKEYHPTIQLRIQNASRAHTQHEFFEEILTMLIDILNNDVEEGTKIAYAIDVALYIFKVDPSHWSTFARISTFDRPAFETKLEAVVHNLLYVQHFCRNSDYSKSTELDKEAFISALVEDSKAAATTNIQVWKNQRKKIVRAKSLHPCYFIWTTNGSEGMASGANFSGVRLSTPPQSIDLLVDTYKKQIAQLEKHYSSSLTQKHILTLIGDNAMNRLRGQESTDPHSYTHESVVDGISTLKCKFSTTPDTGDSEHWMTTITYPHSFGSKYQVTCEKHAAYTDNMASPCCCAVRMHIFQQNRH